MLRKFLLAACVLLTVFAVGCNKEDTAVDNTKSQGEESSALFTNTIAVDTLGLDCIFVPDGSTNIKVSEATVSAVQISFNGCGYDEINKYATKLESGLKNEGYDLYAPVLSENGNIVGITAAKPVEEIITDENFSGPAYSFIYKKEESFISLDISYYGSAGGNKGNGLCKVSIKDNTEVYTKHFKELNNG